MKIFIFSMLLVVSLVVRADDGVFTNTDIFELEYATDPQISPDGKTVAYVRTSMDIMTDRAVPNIWEVDVNGENHRPLLSGPGNHSSPRWSPAGDRLAYVSGAGQRGAQLHVRWMDTGQTAVVSNVRRSPKAISWSPDGKLLAFVMFVSDKNEPLAEPPEAPPTVPDHDEGTRARADTKSVGGMARVSSPTRYSLLSESLPLMNGVP